MLIATAPVYLAARIHGGAIGGAVALAAACPLVVCTPEAWFDMPEARAGFLPTPVLAFLEPLLGPRRALNVCLFPERIDASRAVELGLADHVVGTGEIDSFIRDRLHGLAANPGLASVATSAWQDHFRTEAFRARFAQLMAALAD
jgi:enoyl-CoA hydratase